MKTVPPQAASGNANFHNILQSFLQHSGLPFADVLDAATIEGAFRQRDALFAYDDIFSTPVVLWAFLAQVLRDGKGAATAAAVQDTQPRHIGFTLACQTVLSSWMLLATAACRDPRYLTASALERIAANQVANRPGRIEPRVLKRRRHRYPLMQKPRETLRAERITS